MTLHFIVGVVAVSLMGGAAIVRFSQSLRYQPDKPPPFPDLLFFVGLFVYGYFASLTGFWALFATSVLASFGVSRVATLMFDRRNSSLYLIIDAFAMAIPVIALILLLSLRSGA